jgi:hypothetical protein
VQALPRSFGLGAVGGHFTRRARSEPISTRFARFFPTGQGEEVTPRRVPLFKMPHRNTKFQFALLDENYSELSVHIGFSDAARTGEERAKAEGHRDFYILNLVDRVIENWSPRQ